MKRYNVSNGESCVEFAQAADGNVVLVRDVVALLLRIRSEQRPPQFDNPELYGHENGVHATIGAILKELGEK